MAPRAQPPPTMKKASLGALFLTVFLDLVGFGLVVPFLPDLARREMGASDLVAPLLGTAYSLMQFIFVPVWGRLSDRVGRRPVLLWSIAANVLGMTLLGLAPNLCLLFAARIWSGIATANIAVAQAYVADATPPEGRARGMGMIGVAFGLGFILGPFIGGELGQFVLLGRQGTLAGLTAAALSLANLVLAFLLLPESLPADLRVRRSRPGFALGLNDLRFAMRVGGVPLGLAINFLVIFWFAGMEQTFAMFTDDSFGMNVAATGQVFAFVGIVAALVQGGLVHPLTRRFGEGRLVQAGAVSLAVAFALVGWSASLGNLGRAVLFVGAGLIAFGSGLLNPSVSSYVSRRADSVSQGVTLGAFQSAGALARVFGPAGGGFLYENIGKAAPYFLGSAGMMAAAVLALALDPIARPPRDDQSTMPGREVIRPAAKP
jgi:DHA1 family tetracycline resistance protein-like MFS transporter